MHQYKTLAVKPVTPAEAGKKLCLAPAHILEGESLHRQTPFCSGSLCWAWVWCAVPPSSTETPTVGVCKFAVTEERIYG